MEGKDLESNRNMSKVSCNGSGRCGRGVALDINGSVTSAITLFFFFYFLTSFL